MIPAPNETTFNEISNLKGKLHAAKLPPDLLDKANLMLDRTQAAIKFNGYYPGIDQVYNYIDLITSLPWFSRSQDIIEIPKVSEALDRNHYGLKGVKDRILEYTAVLKLSKAFTDQANTKVDWSMRAPILLLVGLVGVGKTTLAISIAEAMGRKFIRLPFGGLGSALELRGQSRVHADAEPGMIIKAIKRTGTKNPVILFDEVDRVTDEARADIMGVLVELMDPQQNSAYTDHYLDYPFDLSEVLFIATANKTGGIAQAVLDRFEPIAMPVYNDADKTIIAKQYLLPKIVGASGLQPNQITFEDNVWPFIIRPIGYDAGMRTLERTLIGVCRKVAREIVEGKAQSVVVTTQNVRGYIHSDTNLY
jgi:ATP-dependent Lon protease